MNEVQAIEPIAETPTQRARLTSVLKVYHSVPGENTNGPEPISFFRWLDTLESPYQRTVKVGEEWQGVDTGWLGNSCSQLILENSTKRLPGKRPTPEEIEELASKVIEWGVEESGSIIAIGYLLPEEGFAFSPLAVQNLRVRCRKGIARMTYFAVPS